MFGGGAMPKQSATHEFSIISLEGSSIIPIQCIIILYCMADNFHGVLIFVIFVVTW